MNGAWFKYTVYTSTGAFVCVCVCVCVCVGRDGDLVGDKILLLLCLKSLKMYYLLKMNKKQPFFHFCAIHWNSTSV